MFVLKKVLSLARGTSGGLNSFVNGGHALALYSPSDSLLGGDGGVVELSLRS